jgi:hypothetical protein
VFHLISMPSTIYMTLASWLKNIYLIFTVVFWSVLDLLCPDEAEKIWVLDFRCSTFIWFYSLSIIYIYLSSYKGYRV